MYGRPLTQRASNLEKMARRKFGLIGLQDCSGKLDQMLAFSAFKQLGLVLPLQVSSMYGRHPDEQASKMDETGRSKIWNSLVFRAAVEELDQTFESFQCRN